MTTREWLKQAQECEQKMEELLEAEDTGSYYEYLHRKAQISRELAVDAEE
jgi:hypothetical protein